MSTIDYLAVALDDLLDCHYLRRVTDQGPRGEVCVALQDDDVLQSRVHEDIAIETSQGADCWPAATSRCATVPA